MCKELTPWERVVEFHGHVCPGIAIGYRVAVMVLNTFGKAYPLGEEGICIAGEQFCGLDAVQILLGCTYGKANLVVDPQYKNQFIIGYHRIREAYKVTVNPEVFVLVSKWQELYAQQRQPDVTKAGKNDLTLEIVALTQQVMDMEDEQFCVCERANYEELLT